MRSVDWYGVQKEGQEESKIQKENCGGWGSQRWKKSLLKGLATNVVMKIGMVWKEICLMLRVKSVANPGIPKRDGQIKMWMWLFVGRGFSMGVCVRW